MGSIPPPPKRIPPPPKPDDRWKVYVSTNPLHVIPLRGFGMRVGWDSSWWPWGRNNEYPKPDRLAEAVVQCQAWCDRRNAQIEAEEAAVAALELTR